MNLEYLIQIVKKNSLIESTSDIDFLFPDYPENQKDKTLNFQIEEVLKWGYENDKLEDFYSEHLELFIDSGVIEPIIGCKIISNSSIQTSTTFELFQFESQSVFYYSVIGDGENSDCWDTDGVVRAVWRHVGHYLGSNHQSGDVAFWRVIYGLYGFKNRWLQP